MRLKCKNCGFEKDFSEYEDYECPICEGRLINKSHSNKPNRPIEKKKEKILTESEKLDEVLDKQMIATMKREIADNGEDKVWNTLNSINIDQKINFLELFIEAKRQLKLDR